MELNSELLNKVLETLASGHSLSIIKDGSGQVKITISPPSSSVLSSSDHEREHLDTRDAAEFIHHSVFWLCRKENRIKYGIPRHRSGGKNIYYKSELLDWMEKRKDKRRGRPKRDMKGLIESV